jgi:NAD(P)-dependent dehydrogenase (short-subunit alcohol dehydrogenase family)
MREQGYGRVLNVVSNAGLFGLAENIAYAAAKGALVALTRSLALQAAPHNIKVNALAPAAYTRLTANVPDSSFLQWLKRRCDPALVSPVVAWLVHEDCPVSGEIYSTGGGRVARVFVGETAGYVNPLLTAEDVRDHFAQIRDETGYFVPGSAVEEIAAYRRVLN